MLKAFAVVIAILIVGFGLVFLSHINPYAYLIVFCLLIFIIFTWAYYYSE